MTRKELFENERFKNYNCLLIIGSTDIDEVSDENCVDMAFVLYKDLPIFVQDGIMEVAEFDAPLRKSAKVFSLDIGSRIPDTRNCWTRQEIMDAYSNNSIYCLGTLHDIPENTECVVKVEKTLDDFSYEELTKHLCEKCDFVYLFNEMNKENLRCVFNTLCDYLYNSEYDIFWKENVPKKTASICNEIVSHFIDSIEGQ